MTVADIVTLIVGIVAIMGAMGAGLRYLSQISLRIGQLLGRLEAHIRESDETDEDHERRLRGLESRRRRPLPAGAWRDERPPPSIKRVTAQGSGHSGGMGSPPGKSAGWGWLKVARVRGSPRTFHRSISRARKPGG